MGQGKMYNNRNRGIDESDAERERNQIMNEFYNTELNDTVEEDKINSDQNNSYQAINVKTPRTGSETVHQRKKSP
jgi:hypothetical protein